jgi:hypothetical protein
MNTTSRILGEADTPFSQQFKDMLELMSLVCSLSNQWADSELKTTSQNQRFRNSLTREALEYDKKHSTDLAERSIIRHVDSGRRVNDDFWSDVTNDLAINTLEAIQNGTMGAYDSVGSILMGQSLGVELKDPSPDNLPIVQAIADAMDFDVDHIYGLIEFFGI